MIIRLRDAIWYAGETSDVLMVPSERVRIVEAGAYILGQRALVPWSNILVIDDIGEAQAGSRPQRANR